MKPKKKENIWCICGEMGWRWPAIRCSAWFAPSICLVSSSCAAEFILMGLVRLMLVLVAMGQALAAQVLWVDSNHPYCCGKHSQIYCFSGWYKHPEPQLFMNYNNYIFFCKPKCLQKQCLEPLTKIRNERLNTAGNYNYHQLSISLGWAMELVS